MNTHSKTTGVIDASPSGVSGDKYLGALIDLGGKPESLKKIGKTVARILPGTNKLEVTIRGAQRGGIAAKLVTVDSEEDVDERKGSVIRQSIVKTASKIGLSDAGQRLALSIIDTLLDAESRVHKYESGEVHLHEIGSADTLVDIVGTAFLLEELGLTGINWSSSPITVGRGITRFSGHEHAVPPPAVAEILRKKHYPMLQGIDDGELTTPTGAAITVNLAPTSSISNMAMRPMKIGYGAGVRELKGVANVLRLIIGETSENSHSHDQMVVLETNLDDVSGEIVGRAVEKLMQSGARDVSVTPVFMKKNRPGQLITVIADRHSAESLAEVLINETGTFGVREIPVTRHITARTSSRARIQVDGSNYELRIKSSIDRAGNILRSKPEYEDLRRISKQTGRSVKELQNIAKSSHKSTFKTHQRSLK